MSADYITLNGASFNLGGSITKLSQADFVEFGVKQGLYRKFPKKQRELLKEAWKLANTKKK
jgi:hypothetical protein